MGQELEANSTLSHYRIVSKLGAGGMGEVYLAQDTKLDRRVALKILPANVAADRTRMRRFVQEAKAASALNHPNIITIHEIENLDSVNFIATEFIDGETLRQRMRRAPMKLGEVIDIAIQCTSALSAAHAAGIVHRDIKPENIMIRRDGIAKVLDFGLAKLTESRQVGIDAEAPTSFKTDPGAVVGTAIYMSPEQARGLEVDARTDIFSLGVLIYEMVAGRLPFEGFNTNEIMASILSDREATPLARYTGEVPAELQRIVAKALRKNRDERYQTTRDLLLDLKSLKQRLAFEAELERSVAPPAGGKASISPGDQETSANLAPSPNARPISSAEYVVSEIKQHSRSAAVILAVLVLVTAGVVYFFYFARAAEPIDSIVVLPLLNASHDPNADYLSDGISESLINSLSELRQLKVIARSTAFRYKGKEIDPQAVGRELKVRSVLMGRVRQLGDTLDVQVDLVDASTGAQLWGEDYDRKLSDVLAVKQDIAREITEKLRFKLSGEEQKQLVRHDTSNSEAYQFYLRGRYLWNRRTAETLKKAIEEFQQAIERDPNYALGYVGLADCYAVMEVYEGIPANEILPKARMAADRALQLDDSIAEAHVSSAFIYQSMWRWAEAEQEYKRAISLNPNYPTAHHWFSYYLMIRGQFDDALKEAKHAQELDPLSPIIANHVAYAYLLKDDVGAAMQQCQRIIELDPNFQAAHETLGIAYLKLRRNDEAISEFQKSVELQKRSSYSLRGLGYCYAVTGRRAEALQIVKELKERYARHEAIGWFIASVYAGLGDKDQAFVWLEKDFQEHSALLTTITWFFTIGDLRSDPRYADLVHRMGLQA